MRDRLLMATDVASIDRLPARFGRPRTRLAPTRPAPSVGAATTLLMLQPGVRVVFLGFNAGGYFPATPALATIVLSQALLLRLVNARSPFAGFAPATLVAIGALAMYAALTLASALWSHSMGRTLIEFDRACCYLLALLLFGTVRANSTTARWLTRGLVAGISIVCAAGLISRVAPDVWHTAPDVSNERLSYPVTYWNALGLLAALGIVLSFHLTCSFGERRSVRVLAAAVLPVLAATLFFTFSRGAIATGAIGLLVYVLVARPHALLSGALATAPCTAALIFAAYHANLLDTVDPTTPAAISQGHRVALVASVCIAAAAGLRLLLAAWLDPRLLRSAGKPWLSPMAKRAILVGTAGLVLLLILLGAVLGGLAARARGSHRSIYGALLAAGVVWALHAGVDWDWEMPVITLPFFAIAGLALSPRGGEQASRSPSNLGRAILAVACVAAVVLPVLLIGSQSRLTQAEHALYTSNCSKASSAALSSSGWLSARPEPYEILGFCDIERGQPAQAVADMQKALKRDPGGWERYYTLAVAQASAGIDPRPAARRALQMNPLEPLTRQAARALGGPSRAGWVRAARSVRAAALASNDLSIVPS